MLRLLLLVCALLGGNALVVGPQPAIAQMSAPSARAASPVMGNNAPDGPFTPIVLGAKVVLGEKLLNKIRGKAISYHAQFITEFCDDFGVAREVRGALVKKAKVTGGLLGFLS